MRHLQTKTHRHDGVTKFACLLCGTRYQQRSAAVGLFEGDDELGDICPSCLVAGPEGAAERARQQAARIMETADTLVNLADDIAKLGSWESLDTLLHEETKAHEEFVSALAAEELHHKENYGAEYNAEYEELLLTALL